MILCVSMISLLLIKSWDAAARRNTAQKILLSCKAKYECAKSYQDQYLNILANLSSCVKSERARIDRNFFYIKGDCQNVVHNDLGYFYIQNRSFPILSFSKEDNFIHHEFPIDRIDDCLKSGNCYYRKNEIYQNKECVVISSDLNHGIYSDLFIDRENSMILKEELCS